MTGEQSGGGGDGETPRVAGGPARGWSRLPGCSPVVGPVHEQGDQSGPGQSGPAMAGSLVGEIREMHLNKTVSEPFLGPQRAQWG